MARLKTPPVTVVQGDDAPDIVITLQQDSSGTPYVLTDKAAFVVIVDTQEPDRYVAKYEATIEDENAGKVRISWLKDPVELTSYLEDLIPGRRYELQVFLGRTNLPPSYIDVKGETSAPYFQGRYLFTGEYQESAPVFKHETEDLFLSRSPYSAGVPGDVVWLNTALHAATWDEVKDQDKNALQPSDLDAVPIWNALQVISEGDAPDYILYPKLEGFETADPFITPDGKYDVLDNYSTENAGVESVNGKYLRRLRTPTDPEGYIYFDLEGITGGLAKEVPSGYCYFDYADPAYYDNNGVAGTLDLPLTGWGNSESPLGDPPPTLTAVPENVVYPYAIADLPTDIENRGTQTVLTQIPLIVKPAYRLADAD